MGFSSQKYRKERQERPWVIHPVWRGIGCALILLNPNHGMVCCCIILSNQ